MLDTQIIHEFVSAAGRGETDVVCAFIKEHPEALDARDWEGTTALLCAAWHGKVKTVRALLDLGASCTVADDQLYTPLAVAIREDYCAIAALLLRHVAADADALAKGVAAVEKSGNEKMVSYVREQLKSEAERSAERAATAASDACLRDLQKKHRVSPFGKGPRA